jgi:4,5-DOPA dioxygenase extradiol
MSTAPVLFVSHGAPSFALEPGIVGARLRDIGMSWSGLEGVLVISPHWMTPDLRVMSHAAPNTIHDFGGFAAELYRLCYPAPGHPVLALEIAKLLRDAGFDPHLDAQRGFDHGAWVPLLHLLPRADVPVLQVSLPQAFDAADALQLGRALRPLRARGVAVVGSGSLTHNLYEVFRAQPDDADYASAFARWVRDAVQRRDLDALLDYRRRAPQAERAHPTEEHFLPLLVAAGASDETDALVPIDGGMTYSVLSMDAFLWSPT